MSQQSANSEREEEAGKCCARRRAPFLPLSFPGASLAALIMPSRGCQPLGLSWATILYSHPPLLCPPVACVSLSLLPTWEAHDSDWDLGCAQPVQRLLVGPLPVKVQAGDEDLQLHAWVRVFKLSQFLGAEWAGAPREVTGDLVALGLVQFHGTDPLNKATFCVETFLEGSQKAKRKGEKAAGTGPVAGAGAWDPRPAQEETAPPPAPDSVSPKLPWLCWFCFVAF